MNELMLIQEDLETYIRMGNWYYYYMFYSQGGLNG